MPLFDDKLLARFWAKVNKNGPIPTHRPDLGPCWLWTATITGGGYGMFCIGRTMRPAHRVAWEITNGRPIPDDLPLDHLCHDAATCQLADLCPHRRCVNPDHSEPVTTRENVLRSSGPASECSLKTHCLKGHPLSGKNLWISRRNKRTVRVCGTCALERQRKYRRRIKSMRLPRTHCRNGHPKRAGEQICRACRRATLRRWYLKHRPS